MFLVAEKEEISFGMLNITPKKTTERSKSALRNYASSDDSHAVAKHSGNDHVPGKKISCNVERIDLFLSTQLRHRKARSCCASLVASFAIKVFFRDKRDKTLRYFFRQSNRMARERRFSIPRQFTRFHIRLLSYLLGWLYMQSANSKMAINPPSG